MSTGLPVFLSPITVPSVPPPPTLPVHLCVLHPALLGLSETAGSLRDPQPQAAALSTCRCLAWQPGAR